MPIEGSSRHVIAFFILRHWFFEQSSLHKTRRSKDIGYVQTKIHLIEARYRKIILMATGKNNKKSDKVTWIGYANIHIPENHVAEAEAYLGDTKTVWADYTKTLYDGYSMKVGYDPKDESFKATLTCYNPDSENAGLSMSAYGGDWFTALGACLYKHIVISDEDWGSVSSSKKRKFG